MANSSSGIVTIIMGALIALFAFMGKRWSNIAGLILALLIIIWDMSQYSQINDLAALGPVSVDFGLW
ncbi:MAG: hypothetical protein H7X80_07595, partial [bacterium]|nr:hypothetical protein [Candidatus Kapabacteria bacterium]